MIQWLKMLLSDAAEVPCAGPWDCGWGAGAAAGPGASAETDDAAARGRWFIGQELSASASWASLKTLKASLNSEMPAILHQQLPRWFYPDAQLRKFLCKMRAPEGEVMMMIAFITFKSSLVPLLEVLWSSNSWEFEVSGFRRNRTDSEKI